jgi:hypothetical protein
MIAPVVPGRSAAWREKPIIPTASVTADAIHQHVAGVILVDQEDHLMILEGSCLWCAAHGLPSHI